MKYRHRREKGAKNDVTFLVVKITTLGLAGGLQCDLQYKDYNELGTNRYCMTPRAAGGTVNIARALRWLN